MDIGGYVNEKKDTIDLIYIGRLIKRKNKEQVIYAFEELRKKENINLTIVGDGPDKEKLEKISNKVTFTGIISNPEKYYNNSNIFITPSVYGEGLQGTILEAMSCGLKVVATNTEINKKLLAEGRGVFVEPNVESIIKGIKKAIKMDKEEISNKCRNYILKNYEWKNKVEEILEALK